MAQKLFSLRIPNSNGTLVCTLPKPEAEVYLLAFEAEPDNRLTSDFCQTFMFALDMIEQKYPRGVLITTSAIPKFYSNGLDLNHVKDTPNFFTTRLYPLLKRLLTYPMPTVALINGHAFAGGLIVAMHHDYRIQNPQKGYLCMNEVHFGAILETPMVSIFREKVVSPLSFRTLLLEGHRFTAQQAVQEGIIDGLGGINETLMMIEQRSLVKMGKSGVYRELKEDMYRDTLTFLTSDDENLKWRKILELDKKDKFDQRKKKIRQWERDGGRAAKL